MVRVKRKSSFEHVQNARNNIIWAFDFHWNPAKKVPSSMRKTPSDMFMHGEAQIMLLRNGYNHETSDIQTK